jgi:hypothetical protein
MPEKRTRKRAQAAKRAGKSPSTQAGEYVREEIHHVREGKHGARSTEQAIAIGLSKARRSGVKLPAPEKGEASKETRKQARRDLARGRKRTTSRSKASKGRARGARKALKGAGRKAASKKALSRHARAAARRRTASERSASARKAARTRTPAQRRASARKAARTRARRAH